MGKRDAATIMESGLCLEKYLDLLKKMKRTLLVIF